MPPYRAEKNLGTVSSISAEAIGEPGDRTFRLLMEAGEASAHLWIEKEHLQQMAVHIEEVSDERARRRSTGGDKDSEAAWDGGPLFVEFRIGSLSMGHDADTNAFLFLAHDRESVGQDTPDLSFWVTLGIAREFAKQALELCAAGRPRCVLCSLPINPEGHMCVRSNGHQSLHP